MKSNLRHDVKTFVMKSKSSLCRQKHIMTSNSSSCHKILKRSHSKHIMTSTGSLLREKVRNGVQTCHGDKRFVIT